MTDVYLVIDDFGYDGHEIIGIGRTLDAAKALAQADDDRVRRDQRPLAWTDDDKGGSEAPSTMGDYEITRRTVAEEA